MCYNTNDANISNKKINGLIYKKNLKKTKMTDKIHRKLLYYRPIKIISGLNVCMSIQPRTVVQQQKNVNFLCICFTPGLKIRNLL